MLLRDRGKGHLEIDAPAKVNLFLEVLRRREDGYHDINSAFQAVSLFDRLSFSVTDQPGISIKVLGNTDLSPGEDNLVARSFDLMRDRFDLKWGLSVALNKRIPVAAGLGGGSSDAAATILACNLLFDLGLSRSRMSELSLEIGSDLPFFFSHGQALVGGRGEIVEEISLPIDYWLLLVNPGIAISTADSYAALRMDLTKRQQGFSLPGCRDVSALVGALRLSGNDFEGVHRESCPVLESVREALLGSGALLVRMSGSGSTMFGVFGEAPKVRSSLKFNLGRWQHCTVKPITWP
ncbi:MAG: 4-(cytidine 5'-diphospho)-2-C-methyl-D-erythritol kinase [candidate division Zixibacteria bacterium]|nr:4-(cytidine 5'-diphospho)-2-C-methyl-D-erythritol kinase [candidate division Zixibacteria bacterium]